MCFRKPHANLAIGTFYAKMTIETLPVVWYLITEQRQCSQRGDYVHNVGFENGDHKYLAAVDL